MEHDNRGRKRLVWIVGGVLVFVIVAAIVGGVLGSVLKKHKGSDTASGGQVPTRSQKTIRKTSPSSLPKFRNS